MIKDLIKNNWKILIFLALLVIVVYANGLNNAFVSDDIAGYLKNENLGQITLGYGLAHNVLNSAVFNIFGRSPIAFRAINILFHLFNVWLIFFILQILTRKKTISVLTAALFSVHPILIESVSWISGGPYAKSSFFLLFAYLLYISSKNWKKIIFSLILFLIALSFSEKTIIFPLILFIYELSFGSLKKAWLKLTPYFTLSVAWFAANFFRIGLRVEGLARDFNAPATNEHSPLIQIPIAITKYFELIFWPEKLSLYQTEMFFSPLDFWIRTAITVIFFLFIIFTLIKIKKLNHYFFWLSFFVIALLPTLVPLGLGWIVAERYGYLATLGILAVIAILLDKLNNVYKTKTVFILLAVLIILTLAVRTIDRNRDWKNEDTLWIATAKVAPSGHVIHNNLGDVYGRAGDKARAIKEFQTAIAINPYYAEAMHNLANTYTEIGQIDAAIYWYEQAIKYRPTLWQSYQNLGAIYFNLGQKNSALEILKKGLEANPTNPQLIQLMGLIENQTNAR